MPDKIVQHLLVVGGTGMLRPVVLHYLAQGNTVSVVGRSRDRMISLRSAAQLFPGVVNTIRVDYKEDDALRSRLQEACDRYGSFDLILTWIHDDAPRALELIASVANDTVTSCRLFQLCSADHLAPDRQAYTLSATGKIRLTAIVDESRLLRFDMIQHRRIILGFIREDGISRWLTHEEICGGIKEAVVRDEKFTIIGTVSPWESRPA